MRGRCAFGLVFFASGLGAGCFVPVLDVTGRACDANHACPDPLVCGSSGVCVTPGADAGADAGVDSGVLWRQETDGFDAVGPVVEPGASATLDAGNVVEAFVPDAGNATAEFTVSSPAFLPGGVEGKLRGWIRVPATPTLPGKVSFLRLVNANGSDIVSLDLELQGGSPYQLSCYTGPNLLQTNNSFSQVPITLSAGVPYGVEVQWRQGNFRRFFFNGSLLKDDAMGSGGTSAAIPKQLRLGIDHWQFGTTSAPWAIEVGGWEMSDDATAPWPPGP